MRELAAAVLTPILALGALCLMLPAPREAAMIPAQAVPGPTANHRLAVAPTCLSVLVVPGSPVFLVPMIANAEQVRRAVSDDAAPSIVAVRL